MKTTNMQDGVRGGVHMAKEKSPGAGAMSERQPIYLAVNIQFPEQVSFYRDIRALLLCFFRMLGEALKIVWLCYSPYLEKLHIRRKR